MPNDPIARQLANQAAEPMPHLSSLIRKLRSDAFKPEHAHERQWETEEEENARIERNRKARAEWDAATERMIAEAIQRDTIEAAKPIGVFNCVSYDCHRGEMPVVRVEETNQ